MMNAPCKGCQKRVMTKEHCCHSTCTEYAEYMAQRQKIKDARRKRLEEEAFFIDCAAAVRKIKHHKKKGDKR